jgi:1-acyl-sn-glycerol-3-phosphate acyltransferase
MQKQPSSPPKPVAEKFRPELTRLPKYTLARRWFRRFLRGIARPIVNFWLRPNVQGLENFPKNGPAIIVMNHLGDADAVLLLSYLPTIEIDPLGASDLYDLKWLAVLGDWYGVIWLHRGRADRRALACALESLRRGRFVAIAPEGRESLSRSLEEGNLGAAFLALKGDVPVIPIAVTGTENERVYGSLQRFRPRRTRATMTVGRPFCLAQTGGRRESMRLGTERIMQELARLLPEEYRGVYAGWVREM